MPESAAGPAPSRPASPQLDLVKAQLRRSPYALLFIDSVIAWLLTMGGASPWLVVWVLVSAAVQAARVVALRRIHLDDPARLPAELLRIDLLFFLNGLTRVWPIYLAFSGQARDAEYLVTIIMVGLAAGGVGTAAGLLRAYLAWAAPVAVALMAGWILRGTAEGRWTAVLVLVMFAVLSLYVRNFGAMLGRLREQVERANDERDRAEAERHRADDERQRAERAVLAKTRFFAAASHDLRQPLGVLRWYGDAIGVHAQRLGHEPLRAIGEGIGRALAHAEPLVGKYLDIARIEAGALELTLRPVQVARILEQVRQAFAHEADGAGIGLHMRLQGRADALVVVTDESVLRSILDNLVGNAVKFTVAGEVVLCASRVEGPDGPRVRITVRDTGIGIPADEHERVFEDFHQLANPDRSHSRGLGLGLAIVRRQARLLGTAVHLTSEPGRGSTFEFELPRAAGMDGEGGESPDAVMQHAARAGLSLLVIDDEPEVRVALRLMLESVDWKVHTADGLDEALAALRDGYRPDAIVADHRLRGGQTGAQVVEELRRCGCDVPAVIVTGDTSPEQLLALRASGLPVLHKPVQGDRLLTMLVEAVEQRAMS